MAREDSGPVPVSEESKGLLEEVKKGKPRKFAMICQGTEVVSLVLFKKGNVDKHKKEAKQAGKGQFYFGVVDGKGQDLRFALARADKFDSAPVRNSVLKGFLEEAAALKCKPYFDIVDTAPLVLDSDDPLVARFLGLQDEALRACDAHPDRAAQINDLCLQIGGHFDQDQPEHASTKLDELETLLGGLARGAPTAPAGAATAGDDAVLEGKLAEALKKLKPLLQTAIEQHPSRKAELLGATAKIRDAIKDKQFAIAQADVVALGKLLRSLVAAPEANDAVPAVPPVAPPQPDTDPVADFNRRLKEVLTAIKAAAASPAAEKAKQLSLEAGAMAKQRDHRQAHALLDQAEAALRDASADATKGDATKGDAPASVFALWRDSREAVMERLSQLQDALRKHDDRRLHEVADKGLNGITNRLQVGLHVALLEYDRATGADRRRLGTTAIAAVDEFDKFLKTEPLVPLIDKNPFQVTVGLQTDLVAALRRVRDALGA